MKDSYKAALAETIIILLFTIMPTLFILIKMVLSIDNLPETMLYRNGEFYLYSVSLLGTSFLIYNHFKVKKSDNYSLLSFFCLILLVIFSLAYTVMANTLNPNLRFVKWSSWVSIVLSCIIFYYSQVLNNKQSPDIAQQRRDEQQKIEDALN